MHNDTRTVIQKILFPVQTLLGAAYQSSHHPYKFLIHERLRQIEVDYAFPDRRPSFVDRQSIAEAFLTLLGSVPRGSGHASQHSNR